MSKKSKAKPFLTIDSELLSVSNKCEKLWDQSGKKTARAFLKRTVSFLDLTRGLGSSQKLVRRKTLFLLALFGSKRAVPALAQILQCDNCPVVRHEAAYFLGTLKLQDAIAPLTAALRTDEDMLVRHEAAEALGDLGFPEALPTLQRARRQGNRAVRLTAEIACNQLKPRRQN